MSYEPRYIRGELACIVNEQGGQFGLSESNSDYRTFLMWLTSEGKTLEQWLAENPPPAPDIPALKQQKGLQLKQEVEARLATHYTALDLLSLSNLLMEAKMTSKVNRAAYLEPLSAWSLAVYTLFYTAQAQIVAAETVEQIEAISIDFTAWEAEKPSITYAGAIAIAD